MIINKLSSIAEFDLDNGPCFIGSHVLKRLESRFHKTDWVPKDLDILCRNREQMYQLKEAFKSYTWYFNEKERPFIKEMLGIDPLEMIWVIDDVHISATVYDKPAANFVSKSNFTCNVVASDGNKWFTTEQTMNDIQNKVLRFQSDEIIKHLRGEQALASLYQRYDTYISRGYADTNNEVLIALNKLVRETNDPSVTHLIRN